MSQIAMPQGFLLLFATLFAFSWLVPFGVVVRDLRFAALREQALTGSWKASFVVRDTDSVSKRSSFETRADIGIDLHQLAAPISGHLSNDLAAWLFDNGVELMSTSYFPPDSGIVSPSMHVRGRVEGRDSVEFEINPFMSHGVIVLRGSQHGDTLSGTWFMVTDWRPVDGTFVWIKRPAPK